VGPRHRADADHRVAVAGQVLDLEVRVGEGLPKPLDHLTVTLGPGWRARQRVAVHEPGRRNRIERGEPSPIECLLPDCAYARFDIAVHVHAATTWGHRPNVGVTALVPNRP
jgi:hypothetical protein